MIIVGQLLKKGALVLRVEALYDEERKRTGYILQWRFGIVGSNHTRQRNRMAHAGTDEPAV